ncbi:MAG TPA: DedA family protein, partial [Actinobacteria bacterium]|nr:DedA family protein [Actinomycetes bacterium]HEX21189.1 DedA family protein [Actinomycetota bacterium]
MLDIITGYLTIYGYYFLFLATVIESIPFIGLVFPGEVIVVAAGFFAAGSELSLLPVLVIASLGGIVGSNIGYALGFWGGRPLVDRWAHRFHVTDEHIRFAEDYFDNHGAKTVFFGRYMAGLKAFITVLA